MADPVIDILMYHSISEGDHPTQISPSAFAMQIEAIAKTGTPVIGLDDLVDAMDGKAELAERSVIITFDDAFQDFADVAWPILSKHGLSAMVYVPTGRVGLDASWPGASLPPVPIMDWDTIKALSKDGVQFGSHTVTHPNLDLLSEEELTTELTQSRQTLEDQLGLPIRHFAPPYGAAGPAVQRRIGEIYDTSVGTILASASINASRLTLPRVEMYYYGVETLWLRHLTGRGSSYFKLRKGMRLSKLLLTRALGRG